MSPQDINSQADAKVEPPPVSIEANQSTPTIGESGGSGFENAVVFPGLRGSGRALQDTCPSIATLLSETDVDEKFKGWIEDAAGNSFVTLLEEYMTSNDRPVVNAKGSAIGNDAIGNPFADVCKRLPLDDDACYIIQNPKASFLEFLIAKTIPFGKEIIAAKNEVEKFLDETQKDIDEIKEFFLPEEEDEGVCIVANDQMIGIAETPGFPP